MEPAIEKITEQAVWNVVVVFYREAFDAARQTVDSIFNASKNPVVVDLLVNGNPALARNLSEQYLSNLASGGIALVRVWNIPFADKAHAWNHYFATIWSGHGLAFFVDGYARPRMNAFQSLADALNDAPSALGAVAVPSVGKSARKLEAQMIRSGGLHGSLFALTESALIRIRRMKIRLPLGLYRTDATLGAILSFGLDTVAGDWNPITHIRVVPAASWDIDSVRGSILHTYWGHWKRKLRQAQGVLENRAVRQLLAQRRQPANSLPATVDELITDWRRGHPADFWGTLAQSPMSVHALYKLALTKHRPASDLEPKLVASIPLSHFWRA